MIHHYLKLALRSLFRYKFFSFLNIAGLAIGMTCCVIIFLYVRTSLSYDTHHKRADDIYRVVGKDKNKEQEKWMAFTTPMLAPTLVKTFPEVEQAARLIILQGSLIEYEQNKFYEENFSSADCHFLKFLKMPLESAISVTPSNTPNSFLFKDNTSRKYFVLENRVVKSHL